MYQLIFFDLDETLYPRGSALMRAIGRRINDYVVQVVGVPQDQADALRVRWRTLYGTALRGLIEEGYRFDVDHFLRTVHDVPLDGVIGPDPAVRAMLLGLPLRRAVLTNSDADHAGRVLRHLGLDDCFERIVDIRALGFINKPDPNAYQRALALAGVGAREAILVEDTPANTRPAKALGMATILVDCPASPDADYFVSTVAEVGGVVGRALSPPL